MINSPSPPHTQNSPRSWATQIFPPYAGAGFNLSRPSRGLRSRCGMSSISRTAMGIRDTMAKISPTAPAFA